MARRRYPADQLIAKLREAEVALTTGKTVESLVNWRL